MIESRSTDRQVVTSNTASQVIGQVLRANLISAQAQTQAIVQTLQREVVAKPETRTALTAGQAGPRGLKGDKGDKGAPGNSIPAINFSFGDAPSAVWTFDADGVISEVRVVVRTPFDGIGASIQCGNALSDESYMPASFNDPATQADFDNTPDIHVLANAPFWLTITPGTGATQGSGTVLITFLPD